MTFNHWMSVESRVCCNMRMQHSSSCDNINFQRCDDRKIIKWRKEQTIRRERQHHPQTSVSESIKVADVLPVTPAV